MCQGAPVASVFLLE